MDIYGLWDLDRVKLTLGGALTFTEELAALASLHGGAKRSFFFTGTSVDLLARSGRECELTGGMHRFRLMNASPLISTLLTLTGLDACYYVRNPAIIFPCLGPNSILWSAGPGGASTAGRGAMLYLQDFYDQHGRVPRLKFKSSLVNNVIRWFGRRIPGLYPVAVHMKKTASARSQSNAHWPAWREFFRLAGRNSKVSFILIGNDPVPADIARLPHVVSSKCEGLSLAEELALVSFSHFFMGMASGPGQAAVLSDIPYVLYKHPSHHRSAMDREFEGQPRLRFSNSQQCFRREPETAASLMSEFQRMDTRSNRLRWRERIIQGAVAA